MNDPSSSSHQKHHRGGGGGGGGTTPATNTTNTTNNNKITPTASHEDLVAQLVRQSPSVMFNSNSNNSIAKTPSQAEFEQFFQARPRSGASASDDGAREQNTLWWRGRDDTKWIRARFYKLEPDGDDDEYE